MSKKKEKAQTVTVYGVGTVLQRGQIIIPVKLRKSHNVKPGDTFLFIGTPDTNHFNLVNTDTFKGFTSDLNKLLLPEIKSKKGQSE